jgi:tetratricopeptide (TPR) repeat protein
MRHINLKKLLPILTLIGLLSLSSCTKNQSTTCGQSAVLVPGLGSYSRDIGTDSEQAQQFFDQGLRLTMGYYFPEAISSHLEALCYEDDNPMIYWGLALAIAPNPNSRNWGLPDDPKGEGAKAINKALELLEQANEVEKGLIQALAIRYDKGSIPNRGERDEAYITACEKLNQKFPDDMEVTFLLVDAVMTSKPWAYWDKQGNPSEGIQEIINALDQSLKVDSLHPGNNHLYLHLFEASQYPEKALPQAKRLEGLMPKAGHIVHMPSHIYLRLGLYDSTIAVNQRSIKTDDYFLEKWGDKPFSKIGSYGLSAQVHRAHASDFIRFAASIKGNYEMAIKASRLGAESIPKANYHMGKSQHFLTARYFILKIFGKWNAILAEPMPDPEYPYLEGIWRYTRGSAFVATGHIDSAKAELEKINQLSSATILDEILIMGNTARLLLELAEKGLEGEILYEEGDFKNAIGTFREAVSKQDQLSYSEPPGWSQSMRLYLGDALFQAGEYEEAELIFKEDLEEFKENGWALFGLWKSLQLQNKTDEAEDIKLRFEKAWSESDIELERPRL